MKKWSLFVLDFDGTYDDGEVKPLVYLVPTESVDQVKAFALMAHNDFHTDDSGAMCIGDYFEEWLENFGIDYKVVGELDLTAEERQGDFISDKTEWEVV